jgi:hypothetical protein
MTTAPVPILRAALTILLSRLPGEFGAQESPSRGWLQSQAACLHTFSPAFSSSCVCVCVCVCVCLSLSLSLSLCVCV